MSELESSLLETVHWINGPVELNSREKIAKWWTQSVRGQRSYRSPRQKDIPFMTRIPAEEIDGLESEALRDALKAQLFAAATNEKFAIIPVVKEDGEIDTLLSIHNGSRIEGRPKPRSIVRE